MLTKLKNYQIKLHNNLKIIDKELKYLAITNLTLAQKKCLDKAIDAIGRIR